VTEGLTPYPRWNGTLATASRVGVVIESEIQRILQSTWGLVGIVAAFAVGAAAIGQLWELRQTTGEYNLGLVNWMYDFLLWAGLGIAAITGSTTLLDDKRRGALDLYFTRSLTPNEYLGGKALAQLAVAAGVFILPVVAVALLAIPLFDSQPEGYWRIIPVGAAIGIGWALVVVGLSLGVSATGRSTAGAMVLVLGSFVVLEVFLARILEALTANPHFALLSPLACARQVNAWRLGQTLPHDYPVHYALIVLGGLAVLGWSLLWWRRPRVKGAEVDA
jgi:ABC-type transport system involved in multi-copper enzyme maturation permease subunit